MVFNQQPIVIRFEYVYCATAQANDALIARYPNFARFLRHPFTENIRRQHAHDMTDDIELHRNIGSIAPNSRKNGKVLYHVSFFHYYLHC